MSERPMIGVAIPVYFGHPEVSRVLDELLNSIQEQDYPQHRLHVFASVQQCNLSEYAQLSQVLSKYNCSWINPGREVDGPAKNTNAAIKFAANAEYIKIMNQDDFFDSPTAISEMVAAIEASSSDWLINACIHTNSTAETRDRPHQPFWPGEKGMVEGVNQFGCPSVVMFRADLMPECDPALELCLDCDIWIQLYRKGGAPVIRNILDVVIRGWEGNLSNELDYARSLEHDKIYLRDKYGYE